MQCKICGKDTRSFGELLVLSKYSVQYFQCTDCGFIQTEEPYWLEEAYSDAIARQDVGIMSRNEGNANLVAAVMHLLFETSQSALDFGGGHGVFVRMMRDRGFNFYWRDLYASNHFAKGFEYDPEASYDFLTAFEVLEHFVHPVGEIERIMQISPNVLVSTFLVPEPSPALEDWWYFAPSTGQHVSFYTRSSLEYIARRFGRHLLSYGGHHLFTAQPCNRQMFYLAMNHRLARVINIVKRRPALIEADFKTLTGRSLR